MACIEVLCYCEQTLTRHLNSLPRLMNYEIGGFDCHVITTEYIEHVSIVYTRNTYLVMY